MNDVIFGEILVFFEGENGHFFKLDFLILHFVVDFFILVVLIELF